MQNILSQLKTPYRLWVIAFLSVFGIFQTNRAQSQTVSDYHQRADLLLENYLLKYWDGNYIRNTGEWTYIHGMDAVIDGAERTNKQKYYGLIETFYEAQDRRHGWLNDYYDDENWFVLTLIHAYDVTGEEKYLQKAEEIYKDILENAWDNSCCGETTGGLWWNKAKTQKATAANAGAVISGLQLYKRTNREEYRNFAKKVYDFWWTNMVDKTTYQVADHINTDGTKVWWKFTYNEGLMIGASLEMYNTYHKTSYLSYARNIADFMVNNETVATVYGPVLSDGNGSQCSGDCWQFKAPGYKYLMQLYMQDKQKNVYQRVLKGSVDALWNLARNAENSVGVDWTGPVSPSLYNDQTQNAAAMAMSLFAKQSGPYPEPEVPKGQYEAENATIKGILLEANQPGYTGWGFVGGWNNNEQYVKFTVNNGTGGNKTVTLRYAAAGDASRIILINGAAVTTLDFPGTSGWNEFSTTSFTYNFPAGTSTIQVNYNANYVNLDNMTLSPAPLALQAAEPAADMYVYPNPVQGDDRLNITLHAEGTAEVNLQIVDLFGQKRLESKKQLQKGVNMLQMTLNGLSRGTYVLYIKQGTHIKTKRIVVD